MVDKVPDNVFGSDRNRWALNPDNKKANAMDLAFGKLKAECLKNAALSLGKVFGRDLNRKNKDTYKPFKLKGALGRGHEQDVAYVRELIQQANDITQLAKIFKACTPEVLAEVGEEINFKKQSFGLSE
jgi:hypothetical protein